MSQQNAIEDFSQDALVFSPHQDDETLGCGGTILRKIRAGAQVKVIYLTDGTSSHKIIPVEELQRIREKEALIACQKLGIEEKNVVFLRYQDGGLLQCMDAAVEEVGTILRVNRPRQVFLPYHKEPTPDHLATHQIVMAALANYTHEVDIFEYPVWFWHHWPWVSLLQENRRQTRDVLKNTLSARGGLGFLQAFQIIVNVQSVLGEKLAALEQHESQVKRLNSDPNWLTLHDVYKGEFLPCFFLGYEVFHHYPFHPKKNGFPGEQIGKLS